MESHQPFGPEFLVQGELAAIENDEDALSLDGPFSEELPDCGIVVFLLGQDGDQDVGCLSDAVGPLPIDGGIAIDVGSVEEEEVGGEVFDFAGEEEVFFFLQEWGGRSFPGVQLESGKEALEIVPVRKACRYETDGMFRP